MNYSADPGTIHNLCLVIDGENKLGWSSDKNSCHYGTLDEIVYEIALELPYLDFSISIEEVERLVKEKQ